MTSDAYREVLDLLDHYERTNSKLREVVAKLINENAEQENMINELTNDIID